MSPDLCNEDGLTALHQVRLSVSTCPSLCPSLTFLVCFNSACFLFFLKKIKNLMYNLSLIFLIQFFYTDC